MSIDDFLKRGRPLERDRVSPGTHAPARGMSRLRVEALNGRLVVVDATRHLLAAWAGGVVVTVWALAADGSMVGEVAILRRPATTATTPRAQTEWLHGVLASYAPSTNP